MSQLEPVLSGKAFKIRVCKYGSEGKPPASSYVSSTWIVVIYPLKHSSGLSGLQYIEAYWMYLLTPEWATERYKSGLFIYLVSLSNRKFYRECDIRWPGWRWGEQSASHLLKLGRQEGGGNPQSFAWDLLWPHKRCSQTTPVQLLFGFGMNFYAQAMASLDKDSGYTCGSNPQNRTSKKSWDRALTACLCRKVKVFFP